MPGTTFSAANWNHYDSAEWTAASSVTDFTLLIDVSTLSSAWKAAVQSDGADIRLTKGDGTTELAYTLIDWAYNAGAPTGLIAVLFSGASGTSANTVRCYVDYDPGTAVAYDANETYGSDNAFDSDWTGYWPTGLTDVTSHGLDATAGGGVTAGGATGQLAAATDFDGTDDHLAIADAARFDATGGLTAIGWINSDTYDGDFSVNDVVTKDGVASDRSWLLTCYDQDANDTDAAVLWQIYGTGGGKLGVFSDTEPLTTGVWQQIAGTYDGGTTEAALNIYRNGSALSETSNTTGTFTAATSNATAVRIGHRATVGSLDSQFNGKLQHISLHSTARSAAWIAEFYSQVNDQSAFWGTWSGATVTAAVTGTATATIDEDDVTTGGKTIIITLTGDTFKAAGTGPIGTTAESQALIDGITSAQTETTGWNNEVRDNLVPADDLVRTSDTVATITLPAAASYDITAQETITVTVPVSVLVTGAGAITAAPTFTVDFIPPATMTHNMGIGGVSDTTAKYRARLDTDAATIKIEYSTSSDLSGSTISTGVAVATSGDLTGGEEITGLSANTKYYYSILADDVRQHSSPFPSFTTFPTAGVDAAVSLAFGSCQTDGSEATIFASIAADTPNLFIHLGDFGYPDSTVLATQRANYRTQHGNDYLSDIVEALPVERVWDDHDYGGNDEDGDLAGKENSLQAWKEYTAYTDLANASNGLWRKVSLANVDIFLLDTRYQREGVQERFPASSTNTADTGSSGSTLVLAAADSPSASDDNYNGWYVLLEGVYRRVTDYVGATRTCTLDSAVTGLDSATTYAMKRASMLDMDYIASNQVQWLVDGVNNSTAKWKVIATSVAFNDTIVHAGASDTWSEWDSELFERSYLTQEITANNVVLISADRHWAGIDDGTNSFWPENTNSPLNASDRAVEGTFSEGTDATGHKYGFLSVSTSPHQLTLTSFDANGTTTASITPLTLDEADVIPPTLTTAAINTAGTTLTLTLSENVTGQNGWSLTATDGAVTLSSPGGDGTSSHTFSLSRTIGLHETVTASYDSASGNAVDAGGLEIADISDAAVTNGSTQDTVLPTLLTARISEDVLTLTFSENVTGQTAFTLTASGGALTLSSPTGDGTAVHTHQLSRTPDTKETITLDYDSGTGTSQDDAGNALASINSKAVTIAGAFRGSHASSQQNTLAAYIQQHGVPQPIVDITPSRPNVIIDTSGMSQRGVMPNG